MKTTQALNILITLMLIFTLLLSFKLLDASYQLYTRGSQPTFQHFEDGSFQIGTVTGCLPWGSCR